MAACTVRCIESNIRKPDKLFSFYGFFYLEIALSPSRLFSIMDPFLPPKVVCNILNSYFTGEPAIKDKIDRFKDKREGNYLASPLMTSHEILQKFPEIILYTSNFDAGLDDNVEMAKKLQKANVKVELKIVENLPHAFLNYINVSLTGLSDMQYILYIYIYILQISPRCQEAFRECLKDMQDYVTSVK